MVARRVGEQSHGEVETVMSVVERIAERLSRRLVRDAESARALASWQAEHPAPPAQPYGVSPMGAEAWVRDWMKHMGARDAEVTRLSQDGGIDIVASGYVAQVKLYTSPVGIAEVRQLVGAAAVMPENPRTLFFSSGGFSPQAPGFADQVGMALFHSGPTRGSVTAENGVAGALLRTGLSARFVETENGNANRA